MTIPRVPIGGGTTSSSWSLRTRPTVPGAYHLIHLPPPPPPPPHVFVFVF
ncbi:hypothetical protein SAMD00023353_7400090 [Rosellinia necatrix]|uniref:Uncharacterized protein n=1 Tax=Rosellinia necatrix TaxID=77044 RepID=A0A1S8AAT6_ROSNE|nr:hypothetical protein SAMD00023353_7400090 [Rosellinia necatrix]